MTIPSSIPCSDCPTDFRINPLAFLEDARKRYGEVVTLAKGASIDRIQNCAGTIALFGVENTRQVLTNPELFGMPVSVSQQYSFPPRIANLNSSLFSMRGKQHRTHQQLLKRAFCTGKIEPHVDLIAAGCEAFLEDWDDGRTVPLLSEMRRLVIHVSDRLFFGSDSLGLLKIGTLAQEYFTLRREYSANGGAVGEESRSHLIRIGNCLDQEMRDRLAVFHIEKQQACLLAHLAQAKSRCGLCLTEDEVVGHGNVSFLSSTEPVAAVLTWTILLLSQLPELRMELRQELEQSLPSNTVPSISELKKLHLLNNIVLEVLRVLPPNAIMRRLTTTSTSIQGHRFPAGCDILLSPYISHRDPIRFPCSERFLPNRWQSLRPHPFEYLPFGGGAKYCVGKHLATYLLKATLAYILSRYELVLADDQEIDWKISVNLMPLNQPTMLILAPPKGKITIGGRLRGPVSDLVRF